MKALSVLKYLKSTATSRPNVSATSGSGSGNGSDDEDGPYLDLEFDVPTDVPELQQQNDEVRLKVEERDSFNGIQVDGEDVAAEFEQIIRSARTGSKSGQFRVQLVNSATKLRVFMLGLKQSKEMNLEGKSKKSKSNFTRVRMKMEQVKVKVKMPRVSLLKRAPSIVAKSSQEYHDNSVSESNKKDVVYQRFSLNKYLGKSNSISRKTISLKKKKSDDNDSILEQQDGILGAILHCKRSFNCEEEEEGGNETTTSILVRSTSDLPRNEKVTTEVVVVEKEGNGGDGDVSGKSND